MNQAKTDTVKIQLKPASNFNQREKMINVEIQKAIDLYNTKGYTVLNHETVNKTDSFATVKFTLKRMIG